MNDGDDDAGHGPAHLDLVFCSSEDASCPATNLQTRCSSIATAATGDGSKRTGSKQSCLLPLVMRDSGGWESERFCEYPQELVFRVNRGIPTPLDSVRAPPLFTGYYTPVAVTWW